MTHALAQILLRDLKLAMRQGSDVAVLVTFFVITVSLFPFAVGPEPGVLARIAARTPLTFVRVRLLVFLDEFSCESPHILAAVGATDADDVGVHAQQLEVETSR